MDFSIPDDVNGHLVRARTILDDDVIPLEAAWLANGFAAIEDDLHRVRDKVRSAGLWAPQLPTSIGGMGLSLTAHGLMSAVLGRSPLGHVAFGCQAPDAGNAEILHLFGTDAQKAKWLAPLAQGEIRSCFGMTEPENPGSNPTRLSTTARLDGDEWVLDGHKWFTTAADGAALCIVMAVTEPDAAPHQRASMLLVPTSTPGFLHVRNISIGGHGGDGHSSHAELRFEGCRVPADNLLGERGAGFRIAQERLGPGRIHHCMRWIGVAERALELMIDRALDRQLRNDQMLADQQTIQTWVADGKAELEACRWSVLATAWTAEQRGFESARVEVSAIKYLVASTMLRIVDHAVQTHGALGITDDTVLGFWYLHERGARIYDGPDEVHKGVVARQLFKARQRERAERAGGPS